MTGRDVRRQITTLLEEALELLNEAHTLAAFGGKSTRRITKDANQPLARHVSDVHRRLDALLEAMETGQEGDD